MPSPSTPLVSIGESNATADAKNVASLTELRSFYSAMTKDKHLVAYCSGRVNNGGAAGTYALSPGHHLADNAVLINAAVPFSLIFGCIYIDPADWGFGGNESLMMQATIWTCSTYTGTSTFTVGLNATTGFSFGSSGQQTQATGIGASLGSIAFGTVAANANTTSTANLTVPSSAGFYAMTGITSAAMTAVLQFEVQIYGWDE